MSKTEIEAVTNYLTAAARIPEPVRSQALEKANVYLAGMADMAALLYLAGMADMAALVYPNQKKEKEAAPSD